MFPFSRFVCSKRSQDDAKLTDAEKLAKMEHQFTELLRRANEEKTRAEEEKLELLRRAEEEKARANEEKARADEEKARADEEKSRAEASIWLDKVHAGGVKFATAVASAMPHQTPRYSSSKMSTSSIALPAPPRNDAEAIVFGDSVTTTSIVTTFWVEVAATLSKPTSQSTATSSFTTISPSTTSASTTTSSATTTPPTSTSSSSTSTTAFSTTTSSVTRAVEHTNAIETVCMAIKANRKISEAYRRVVEAREERGKAAEVTLVHPFAHELFGTIHKAAPLPGVHLYLEREMPIDGSLSRRPDQLFYVHSDGSPPDRLNACMQRNGVLSIELKSILDLEHAKLAMVELLRDFAHTVGEGVEREKCDFYGLMGDGVDWIATRWQTVFSAIELPFHAQQSERFSLNLDDDDSLRQFVSRTLSLRAAAVRRSKHSTGWNVPPFCAAASGQVAVDVRRVVGITESCVVAECYADQRAFGLKIRSPIDSTRCERDASARESLLGFTARPPNIVHCSAVQFFGVRPVLQLDAVGTALEDACLCDADVRAQLARVVHDDVRAALQWLHDRGLAFVDLHPGNVVIVGGRAHLIDLESCSALGVPTAKPIRAAFRTLGDNNTPTRDTDWRGLMLVLAWILDVDSFRTGVARTESRTAGADKAAALVQSLGTLEQFVDVYLSSSSPSSQEQ
jgi:hypothetical protein